MILKGLGSCGWCDRSTHLSHNLSPHWNGSKSFCNQQLLHRSDDVNTVTPQHPISGEEAFERYLSLTEKLSNLRNEMERNKSEQMYEAWKKADEKEKNEKNLLPKNKGIVVVKTIVKQTRETLTQKQSYENSLTKEIDKVLHIAAEEYKHPNALVILGNKYLNEAQNMQNSIKEQKDLLQQVLRNYKLAGQKGLAEGWYNLGHIFWTGIPDQSDLGETANNEPRFLLAPDKDQAMKAFLEACYLNDSDAMYFVGVQMMDGDSSDSNVHVSLQEGLQWIKKSASLQHGGALYYLALFYLNGDERLNIRPGSDEDFKQRLDHAAEIGISSQAYFLRGNCYFYGENGYNVNYCEAFDNFVKAADLGNGDAAVSAGAMLFTGNYEGVGKNQTRAFELYQRAGELGCIEGWRNVVACYATGEGVPKSTAMAKYIAETMLLSENGK